MSIKKTNKTEYIIIYYSKNLSGVVANEVSCPCQWAQWVPQHRRMGTQAASWSRLLEQLVEIKVKNSKNSQPQTRNNGPCWLDIDPTIHMKWREYTVYWEVAEQFSRTD